MSASTRSVPAPIGWGRFPTTLAAVALVVILAVAVALVALNGTKAAPATGTKGAPPPAFHDSDARGEMYPAPVNVPFHDSDDRGQTFSVPGAGNPGYGGWNGPRLDDGTSSGGHGTRIAQ
jgi:hypothetical protein